jgi:hypothetical protein
MWPRTWGRGRAGDGSALTDADGRFRIAQLVPGRYRISAFSDGKLADAVDAFVGVGSANEPVTLRVANQARVRGKVVSAGRPVAGARVLASRSSPARRSEIGISQADGTFVLERVPAGEVSLSAAPYKVTAPAKQDLWIFDVPDEIDEAAWKKWELTSGSLSVKELNLFGAKFPDQSALAIDRPLDVDVIGLDFLRSFDKVSLDFRRRSIVLERQQS